MLLVGLLIANLSGCSRRPLPATFTPLGAGFSAPEDSLGLDEFLALLAGQRDQRRQRARLWLDRADRTSRLASKLGCLANAAGLAPDDPETWCRLAETRRWAGDFLLTSSYLEMAEQSLGKLDHARDRDRWRNLFRRLILNRAWLHYDRGEYGDARLWVRSGRQLGEGDAGLRRIAGLVAAGLSQRSRAHELAGDMLRSDAADPDAHWIMAILDRAQNNDRAAFNYVADLRPDHHHAAECYRDKGEIAELLGEWTYARRWYAESAAALPLDDPGELQRLDIQRLEATPHEIRLPVWLAFNRYYVTGSLSAYATLARERYAAAEDPAAREFWAGQLVDVTGILVRKRVDRAQALKVRGLVFADKDMNDRARKDLERANRILDKEGRSDPRIQAELGRLWLLEEQPQKALPHLRQALRLQPDMAQAWSDLGLCHIMGKNENEARDALARAIELQPDLAAAWYNRGLMNVHAGSWQAAQDDLSEAARLTPDNPEIGRLLQQVRLRLRDQ